ncbi:unnamed protein product [Phytomonas sp. EM1]|nr:unnamed protein product [Phytomonas sp. EM1]|eukprot:CCW60825.1 unnamed protein product [Phytomonas sp. isolate EM1]
MEMEDSQKVRIMQLWVYHASSMYVKCRAWNSYPFWNPNSSVGTARYTATHFLQNICRCTTYSQIIFERPII